MLLTCGLVEWEVMTLKKTGGFTLRDSNFYDPKSNPPAEPVSTATAITTVENKNVAAQQQSDQIAMAPYKYLPILYGWLTCVELYVSIIPIVVVWHSTNLSKE